MSNPEENESCRKRFVLPLHNNAVMKRIMEIHGPDNIDFNMSSIINVIEDIMFKSNEFPDTKFPEKPDDSKIEQLKNMPDKVAFKINVISYEILGKCYRTEDITETTLSMFTSLSSFTWTAKAAVALAAFAINYGYFRLVVEQPVSSTGDDTAKTLAFLEQVPPEMCETRLYKDITDLAEQLLLLTRTVWKLGCFYNRFIEPGSKVIEKLHDQLPTITAWIVQSIVVCQSLITHLSHTGYEYMSSSGEEWELSCLKKKLSSFYTEFENDAAKELPSLFPKNDITVLKKVICSEEYMNLPLALNPDKKEAKSFKADTLEKEKVLLYISTLDVDEAEIKAVERVNDVVKSSEMVLVWLPVLDTPQQWKKDEKKDKNSTKMLKEKRDLMPWHVVRKPQYLDPTIIAFIKNTWGFKKTSKIMVFDSNGILENDDALPMILVWGSSASPFTSSREDELWRESEKAWKLDSMLTDSIQADINVKIEEDKYICLFGGEDVKWIEDFTKAAESIIKDLKIAMEKVDLTKTAESDIKDSKIAIEKEKTAESDIKDSKMAMEKEKTAEGDIKDSKIAMEKDKTAESDIKDSKIAMEKEKTAESDIKDSKIAMEEEKTAERDIKDSKIAMEKEKTAESDIKDSKITMEKEDLTKTEESIIKDSKIAMEMIYIGASKQRKAEEIKAKIKGLKFVDRNLVWLFWARIEAMYNYCCRRGITPDKDSGNPITEGVTMMRSFDKSGRSWAIVSKGSGKMCRAFADIMLKCFEEYDEKWKSDIEKGKDFLDALQDHISMNCETVYFPISTQGIPEKKICTVCRRMMRKSYTFSCWGKEEDDGDGR